MRCPDLKKPDTLREFNRAVTALGGRAMSRTDVSPRQPYLASLNTIELRGYHLAHYYWNQGKTVAGVHDYVQKLQQLRQALVPPEFDQAGAAARVAAKRAARVDLAGEVPQPGAKPQPTKLTGEQPPLLSTPDGIAPPRDVAELKVPSEQLKLFQPPARYETGPQWVERLKKKYGENWIAAAENTLDEMERAIRERPLPSPSEPGVTGAEFNLRASHALVSELRSEVIRAKRAAGLIEQPQAAYAVQGHWTVEPIAGNVIWNVAPKARGETLLATGTVNGREVVLITRPDPQHVAVEIRGWEWNDGKTTRLLAGHQIDRARIIAEQVLRPSATVSAPLNAIAVQVEVTIAETGAKKFISMPADEALREIDGNITLATNLLECLRS